ncbi:PilZ domain-containing protein [Rhodopseudomonas palustris]|uniref:Type IV pilus assembly PilZ n=1 Tax=Rhodopseudomonas palustris (strain BisB18) TaxID=316056 RepID=Q211S4_RHOPB
MLERRQHFRGRVFCGGRIAFNERESSIDCIVRNLSSCGAKVEFNNAAVVPDHVDLTITRKSVGFLARIVWCRQDQAGLEFHGFSQRHAERPLDLTLRLRATERADQSLRAQLERLRSGG